jgi:tripartite-type tricarboxylate transporter receptor subunit TctC
VTAPSPLTVNQSLYPKLAFDPAEFVPVSILATIPTGFLVNPKKVSANTVAEFVAFARAHPGAVTAATQGNGATSHLTSEWFQMEAKVKFVQVPYRGSAPALQGLLAGDVDIMFDNLGVSLALVKSGQLKLLAVASAPRLRSLPDVPTIAETIPGFVSSTWVGAFLPPKTPQSNSGPSQRGFRRGRQTTRYRAEFSRPRLRAGRQHGRGSVRARGNQALDQGDPSSKHQARVTRRARNGDRECALQ